MRWRRPSLKEAGFLARCLWTVCWVRLGLTLRQFERVRGRIAAMQTEGDPSIHELRHVAWGVTAASRLVPGASCLTQALAGQYLLARGGKSSIVRVSVQQKEGFHAHAWLIAADTLVLGGTGAEYAGHAALIDYGA